jgi:hypothetical protein
MMIFQWRCIMSQDLVETPTQHAMLVIWGQFAQALGLIQDLAKVPLHQKKVRHDPHTKLLEFFLAVLAGLEHLQELSAAAEPIEKDLAVARAWLQPDWADFSGVSRTLTALTQAEAEQIVSVLDRISQPFIDREAMLALANPGYLTLDGDLTAQPVSNTATTYPEAAYGHIDENQIGLCYQVAKVSMRSPTNGRLMLSSALHPGDVVSCTQAQALIRAAETRLGLRPMRRTDLLAQRLAAQIQVRQEREQRYRESQQALEKAQARLSATWQAIQACQTQLAAAEQEFQAQQRPERPFSQPGKLRRRLAMLQQRKTRLVEQQIPQLEGQLAFRRKHLSQELDAERELRQRLELFEHDNATNSFPIRAIFRLDAGFGTAENLAWSIEMGYDVYTRPYGDWLKPRLKRLAEGGNWMRVGKNAEMVVWKDLQWDDFPYPLDAALERFQTGAEIRHAALLHFGQDAVTRDLPGWFTFYNARQTVEAGIKEGKGTFAMHYLKVRSKPALYLQEQFARFAANFVRWASEWLAGQCPQIPTGWEETAHPRVKQQVKIGAHTSAWVGWLEQGCLLRFTDHSIFAGRSFQVNKSVAIQLALPFAHKSLNLRI